MKLIEVKNKKDFTAFLEVPRKILADDPNFISQLDKDIKKVLSDQNRRLKRGGLKMWIALTNDDQPLGRIAAFYESGRSTGGIGFFETVDDEKVAFALFDIAMEFLKEFGMNRVEAPINFGERDRFWGLLVDGFSPPMYLENYNPPYYRKFFDDHGFVQTIEQKTYEIAPEYFNNERFEESARKIEESDEFKLEHFKMHSVESYAEDFARIYNAAWLSHEHFEPLSKERVIKLMESMKYVIREDLIWFTYANNEPVAFYASIIDINQILKHLNGKMDLWGMLKFLWYKNTIKVDRVKGLVFGVIPEYQGRGLYSAMIMRVFDIFKKDPHLKYSELSWVGDFNPRMKNLLDNLGARPCKVHLTYEKSLVDGE